MAVHFGGRGPGHTARVIGAAASAGPSAPVLKDNTVPYGDLTGQYQNAGMVDLWDLLGVSKPSGAMEWEVLPDTTGGASTNTSYFDYATGAAAADFAGTGKGRTPAISGSGESNRCGTSGGTITGIFFKWKYRLRVDGGPWSNQVTLRYDIRPNVLTVGNNYVSDNYPQYGLLGNRTPTQFYNAGGRALELAVGLRRSENYFSMGSGFSFPGPEFVAVRYADTARPTLMTGVGFGGSGSSYVEVNGIKFKGFGSVFNGHVVLAVSNYRVINCEFIDLETEFGGWSAPYAGWTCINATPDSTNGLVDGCTFRHKNMPIAAEGSSLEVRNCWFDHIHRVPVYIGITANGLNFHNNLATNPHLTVYPSMDTNPATMPHTDWFQLADTNGTQVAQNVTCEKNAFLMGNANSSNRGFAGGGSGGVGTGTCKSANLKVRNNIWTSWGVDVIEAFSFDGTCSISGNYMSLQLCSYANDYPASTIDAGKDRYGPVGPRFSVSPANAANVGASATLLIENNFSDSTYSANANAAPKITEQNNVWANRDYTAFASGFTEGNPRTKLEAIPLSVVDPSVANPSVVPLAGGSEYLAILAYAMNAVRRSDGRGPVNSAGTAFNS